MDDTDLEQDAYRILLVEDNHADARLLEISLEDSPEFKLTHVSSLEEARGQLTRQVYDLVLLDLHLPDGTGQESFDIMRRRAFNTPIVVMTGLDDGETGRELVKRGAQDFLVKGEVDEATLARCLRYAIERYANELSLREAREEAIEASRAKSDFLAGMSHEIRTPMNSILGMADLLLESTLSQEQENYLRVIQNSSEALLELINGILDLSKIEAGKLELESTPFDLHELLETMMEIVAYPAHKKRLDLAIAIDPEVPRWVVGDPSRLRQILINLVGNAIKFTTEGEIVVEVNLDPKTDHAIHVSVRDTGAGIQEDKLAAIFEPFTQADASIARQFGGTGLGLSISLGLARAMDGEIWAESRVGEGSTFHVSIVFEDAPAEAALTRAPLPSLTGRRVLVVDDNPTERAVARRILCDAGATVVDVDSSAAGIEEVQRSIAEGLHFDAILLDSRMPEAGGFQVAEVLREHPEIARRAIMMLSMARRQDDVPQCKEFGLGGWIAKPMRPTKLLAAVEAVSNGGTAGDALKPASSRAPSRSVAPMRILLADDLEDNRALVQAYLKSTPHALVMASDGVEAVQKFKQGRFDLVLMDIQMPGMTGYEATAEIRRLEASEERPRTPIVALTAFAYEAEKRRSREAGCDAHLTKPIKKATLLQTLEGHSRSERPVARVDSELAELVDGYLENRRADIENLTGFIRDREADEIRRLGHNMKGSGKAYGFDLITAIGANLEQAGRNADFTEAEKLLDQLNAYLDEVEIIID